MYKTTKRLHLPCMVSLLFEKRRKQYINNYCFLDAVKTYKTQKLFLDDANSGDFWDEKFETYTKLNPMELWRTKLVLSLLKKNSSVLNIGVGSGKFEKFLFSNFSGIDYVGTDITKKTLNHLKKEFPKKKFVFQKLPHLLFRSNSFDQIILLEVLEHIKPSETLILLKEIQRVLKNNGQFIVSIPINEGLEQMLPDNPNSHMRIYSKELMSFELKITGFRIDRVYESSAFDKYFGIKHILNMFFSFRHPNNLVFLCSKK